MNSGSRVEPVKLAPNVERALIVLILLLSVAFRLYALTDDIMYDPAVYAQDAHNLLNGTFRLNTDSWYSHRLPVLVPVALAYAALGVRAISTNLWPLLLSILQIIVIVWLGSRWLGRNVGILAGLLAAIMPLDVIYSGILSPDAVIAAFLTFSVAFWISGFEGRSAPSRSLLFLSGLFSGIAVATRAYALLIALFFAGYAIWRKASLRNCLWWCLGIASVAVPVVLLYSLVTGDPLFSLRAMTSFYGAPERSEGMRLLYYPRLILSLKSYTGLFALFFTVIAVWGLVRPTRRRLVLLAWMAPILLYLQFGSMSFHSYVPIFKRVRFLTPFTAPAALLAALVILEELSLVAGKIAGALKLKGAAGLGRALLVSIVLVLFANSLWIVRTHRIGHAAIAVNFRKTVDVLRTDRSIPVLFDHWRTAIRFGYYFGFEEGSHLYEGADETQRMVRGGCTANTRLGYLKWYEDPSQIPDAFVVLEDGILSDAEKASIADPTRSSFPAKDIPFYCQNPPQSWELLGRFGTFRVFRTHPGT
ncbi:MAG: glycosyltransferase family 39 protein [Candidatus Eisenbacteria bacterium]|nr:glycosyltransferase family 39 protein [Candidatus Eisenbacteria bacterium]